MPDPDDTQLIAIDADALDRASADLREASRAIEQVAQEVGATPITPTSFGAMNTFLATSAGGLGVRATDLLRLGAGVASVLAAGAADAAQEWRDVDQGVSDAMRRHQIDLDGARDLL